MSVLSALFSLVCALGALHAKRMHDAKIVRSWQGKTWAESARAPRTTVRGAGRVRVRIVRAIHSLLGGEHSRRTVVSIRSPDLALLVTEVSSRLRAGAPVEWAWRSAFERILPRVPFEGIDEDGSPRVLKELGKEPSITRLARAEDWVRYFRARSPLARAGARAARALRTACRLAYHNGAPLASILDAVAAGLDEAEAAEEARRIASQGARTSTRILLALPLLAVCAGEAIGAHPLQRFLDGSGGTMLGVLGLSFLLAARIVSARLIARAAQAPAGLDPALACDLARAGLQAGASIPAVLESLGIASEDEDLGAVGRGLRLGLSWEMAWEGQDRPLLAGALEGAWRDGIDPEGLLVRSAAQFRSGRIAQARARAEALGVELAVPLAALLLPSFLILGLGPVLLHLVESGFSGFAGVV